MLNPTRVGPAGRPRRSAEAIGQLPVPWVSAEGSEGLVMSDRLNVVEAAVDGLAQDGHGAVGAATAQGLTLGRGRHRGGPAAVVKVMEAGPEGVCLGVEVFRLVHGEVAQRRGG